MKRHMRKKNILVNLNAGECPLLKGDGYMTKTLLTRKSYHVHSIRDILIARELTKAKTIGGGGHGKR